MTEPFKVTDAGTLLSEVLSLAYFHPLPAEEGGETPIPVFHRPGEGSLIVVVGENASGKSFFRRLVKAVCSMCQPRIECIDISMEGRGREYGGFRGFIYGSEEWDSTGVNSTHTVITGIRTCRSRETPHTIFWDEPDLGLSENGAAGMGMAIAAYMRSPNPLTLAACVVTHSKPLARELAALNPHYLFVGGGNVPQTLQDWLNLPLVPRSPEDIKETGHRRFQLIQKILNRKKKDFDRPPDGT